MRSTAIESRLCEHFEDELECLTATVDKATWLAFNLAPNWRFGWMPPTRLNDAETGDLIVLFSPELINEVTAELSDDQLDTYLTIIEMYVDATIADPDASPTTIRKLMDGTLFEQAPYALTLWSETEARALDAGIVPVAT